MLFLHTILIPSISIFIGIKKKKKKKVDLKGVRNNVPKGCSKNCEMN